MQRRIGGWLLRRWSRSSTPTAAWLMAAAILISAFGCANGMSLAGARVYYAMSRGWAILQIVGKLHPRYRLQRAGCWCSCLDRRMCVSGSYSQLLDYIIFAVLVFTSHHRGAVCAALQKAMFRPTRRWAIQHCRRFTSSWQVDLCRIIAYKPQYTCRVWCWFCSVFLCIFFWSRRTVNQAAANQT